MRNKIKKLAGAVSCLGYWLTAKAASAAGTAGIAGQTADQVGVKIVEIAKETIMPFGAAIIFVSIAISAFKIITTANNPRERAEAMGSLPYILCGGLLLGGAMLVAGFIVGLMTKTAGGQ